jgi:hypothetical protein
VNVLLLQTTIARRAASTALASRSWSLVGRLQRRRHARLHVQVGADGTVHGFLLALITSFLGVPGSRSLQAADPRPSSTKTSATSADLVLEAGDVPTFWIIVAQGASGVMPRAAPNFIAMWLDGAREGFTHRETTLLTNLSSLVSPVRGGSRTRAGSPWRR